uniref:Uncharacterized protein n=1 Tax=Arundo donax TaxID=35708 RepID=A0A0A9DF48_ARUDO
MAVGPAYDPVAARLGRRHRRHAVAGRRGRSRRRSDRHEPG